MSTPLSSSQRQTDLVREVAALRRAFGKLLKRLEQPVGEADYTIHQWCKKRKISKAGFYKMRKGGRAPHVLENGGLRRITRQADQEWEQRWGSADAAPAQEETVAIKAPKPRPHRSAFSAKA